jgi:hypothetical protein
MKRFALAIAAAMVLLTSPVVAQDTPETIVFGQYYRCNQGQEARADEIVRGSLGPIIQKHIDAGHLTGWVWLSHVQGGDWRRVLATLGTDLNTMMDARTQIVDEFTGQNQEAAGELGSICPGHDDYIWIGIANSPLNPEAPTGPASISTYYACDQSREGRTSEIFEEVLAPLYQKHMDMGHLTSWGFYGHRMGGIFRRLETFSGADHKTLLAMQDAIYTEAGETNALAMNEFRQICSWHTDYMWSNATQQ